MLHERGPPVSFSNPWAHCHLMGAVQPCPSSNRVQVGCASYPPTAWRQQGDRLGREKVRRPRRKGLGFARAHVVCEPRGTQANDRPPGSSLSWLHGAARCRGFFPERLHQALARRRPPALPLPSPPAQHLDRPSHRARHSNGSEPLRPLLHPIPIPIHSHMHHDAHRRRCSCTCAPSPIQKLPGARSGCYVGTCRSGRGIGRRPASRRGRRPLVH
mmetsp:Transcript_16290/g.31842  ORF Transcript_16290/g.31842 Transcript_16290/m.31842 type:complete len:215 (+) Transcript_16290:58-702(+)